MSFDRSEPHRACASRCLRAQGGRRQGLRLLARAASASVVWDARTLDRWLADPDQLIPGQRMGYSVPEAADRADLIAYLRRRKKRLTRNHAVGIGAILNRIRGLRPGDLVAARVRRITQPNSNAARVWCFGFGAWRRAGVLGDGARARGRRGVRARARLKRCWRRYNTAGATPGAGAGIRRNYFRCLLTSLVISNIDT